MVAFEDSPVDSDAGETRPRNFEATVSLWTGIGATFVALMLWLFRDVKLRQIVGLTVFCAVGVADSDKPLPQGIL